MPFTTESKEIDGHDVKVGKFPATVGLKLKFKLFQKISPGLTTLAKGLDNSEDGFSSKNLDLSVLPEALDKFFSVLDPDQFLKICLDLLQTTHVDNKHAGKIEIFDDMFAGEFGLLYKVLGFVVEVNFKSFLELLPIGKAQGKAQLESTEE